jgi:hypothetical protein
VDFSLGNTKIFYSLFARTKRTDKYRTEGLGRFLQTAPQRNTFSLIFSLNLDFLWVQRKIFNRRIGNTPKVHVAYIMQWTEGRK